MLRERAVALLEAGNAQLAIAAALGVRQNTAHRWLKGWRVAGTAALEARKHGLRPQAQRLPDANQVAGTERLMIEHGPDQLDPPLALQGRAAVRDLVQARFGAPRPDAGAPAPDHPPCCLVPLFSHRIGDAGWATA